MKIKKYNIKLKAKSVNTLKKNKKTFKLVLILSNKNNLATDTSKIRFKYDIFDV